MEIEDFRPYIDQSFQRFIKCYEYLEKKTNCNYLVLNITPSPRIAQNLIVNYFNDLLASHFSNKIFENQ